MEEADRRVRLDSVLNNLFDNTKSNANGDAV